MEHYYYLAINIVTFFSPLFGLLLFRHLLTFSWKRYLYANVMVTIPFLIWDALATYRGDWHFNPRYTTGIMLGNLPLEEVLFFVTTSFAALVIWESLQVLFKGRVLSIPRWGYLGMGALFFLVTLLLLPRYYSVTIFGALAVTMCYLAYRPETLQVSQRGLLLLSVIYIPFFIVNYLLTSIPIVQYADAAFSTIRITTIPLEDFCYNALLIGSYWGVYTKGGTIQR